VSAKYFGLDFNAPCTQFFFGWSSDLPLISLKAFETARLVMGRRNVDFDEKEAAILLCFAESKKMAKRIAVSKS
jgi:hypothetical protein